MQYWSISGCLRTIWWLPNVLNCHLSLTIKSLLWYASFFKVHYFSHKKLFVMFNMPSYCPAKCVLTRCIQSSLLASYISSSTTEHTNRPELAGHEYVNVIRTVVFEGNQYRFLSAICLMIYWKKIEFNIKTFDIFVGAGIGWLHIHWVSNLLRFPIKLWMLRCGVWWINFYSMFRCGRINTVPLTYDGGLTIRAPILRTKFWNVFSWKKIGFQLIDACSWGLPSQYSCR